MNGFLVEEDGDSLSILYTRFGDSSQQAVVLARAARYVLFLSGLP